MEPICKTDRLKPITAIDSILFYRYLDSGNCYTFAVENINYLKMIAPVEETNISSKNYVTDAYPYSRGNRYLIYNNIFGIRYNVKF